MKRASLMEQKQVENWGESWHVQTIFSGYDFYKVQFEICDPTIIFL